MSRYSDLTSRRLPPSTSAIITLCCFLYLLQILANVPALHHVTMCPRNVIYLHEYYRVITSALFHGGFMHIAMNMMSTLALSSLLEQVLGTFRHILSVLSAIIFTNMFYLLVAYLASAAVMYDDLMYQHAVGFSGILFHMLVLESTLGGEQAANRSLFGFITVPSWLYPWVLLAALQLFMPNLSLLGHLSGIISGYMQLYGVFDLLFIPDDETLKAIEQWRSLRPLTRAPTFVATHTNRSLTRDPAEIRRTLCNGARKSLEYACYGLETVRVILFGRSSNANSNVQFTSHRTLSSQSLLNDIADDDQRDDGSLSAAVKVSASELV